ncbi:MAG: hypothetical protein Q8P18_30960 [Pseudomonadota bacterium]|nr:hypothetical protein [Pseudomonadota bacterium]
MRVLGSGLGVLLLSSCGFRECEPIDEALVALLPARLSESGLYPALAPGEVPGDIVADDVIAYAPRFGLWSDGAEKRRWIRLPAEGVIDTSDPDEWRFPEGTRAWKEFVRDGVRVETRVFERVGPEDADWVGAAYLWSEDDTDATLAIEGEVDARGTAHDVPAAETCAGCHGGRKSFLLGFSAVQLAGVEGVDLAALAAAGRLSEPVPEPTVPGDDLDQQALGYLHANCSHCHNQDRPERSGSRCYDPDNGLDFSLLAGSPALADTPALETADQAIGHGEASELLWRISERNTSGFAPSMPPLATEVVDAEAIETLTAWIARR